MRFEASARNDPPWGLPKPPEPEACVQLLTVGSRHPATPHSESFQPKRKTRSKAKTCPAQCTRPTTNSNAGPLAAIPAACIPIAPLRHQTPFRRRSMHPKTATRSYDSPLANADHHAMELLATPHGQLGQNPQQAVKSFAAQACSRELAASTGNLPR